MSAIIDNYMVFGSVFFVISALFFALYKFFIKKEKKVHIEEPKKESLKKEKLPKKSIKLSSKTLSDHDEKIFESFSALLPAFDDSVRFLKKHDVSTAFHGSKLDSLYKLLDHCKSSSESFSDRVLEDQRKELKDLTQTYLMTFSKSLELLDGGNCRVIRNIDILKMRLDKILKKYEIFVRAFQ